MDSPTNKPKVHKFHVVDLVSDIESDSNQTTPIDKSHSKTQIKEQSPEKTGLAEEPKSKYRVAQVISDKQADDNRPHGKVPASDHEPNKGNGHTKKQKNDRISQLDIVNSYKDKARLDGGGLDSARSDKDMKVNLSSTSHKIKKFGDNTPQGNFSLESGGRGTFEAYEKLLEVKGVARNAAEIDAENKQLRQFLKDLSEQLQQHIQKAKITEYAGKKVEFKNKDPEEQIRTIVRELANNEKILAYNQEEYRKTEARLNAIKDPKYVMNMQQEITKLQIEIDAIKKENKQLDLKNGSAGKNLDDIENVRGMPVSLEETHLKEKEATKLAQKLEQLKQKNQALLEERKKKLEKEKTVAEQIKKLERACFGDSYVSEQDTQKYSKLSKMAGAAEEDLKTTNNRCKFKATQVARDLEDLYMLNHKEREHIEKLEEVMKEQAKALKEVLSNEGSRLSKGSQDVLEQIRASLENEENRKRLASPEGIEDAKVRDKERSANLLRKKQGSDVKLDKLHYDMQSPSYSSSKHKKVIRRELEEKKPFWKETQPGEKMKLENLGNVKVKKGEEKVKTVEDVVSRKQSVVGEETPKKNKSKQNQSLVRKEEADEVEEGEKKRAKKGEDGTLGESPREGKMKAKKGGEDSAVRKKEVKTHNKEEGDDAEELKKEINKYSSQLEQEVVKKNKKKEASAKKKEDGLEDGEVFDYDLGNSAARKKEVGTPRNETPPKKKREEKRIVEDTEDYAHVVANKALVDNSEELEDGHLKELGEKKKLEANKDSSRKKKKEDDFEDVDIFDNDNEVPKKKQTDAKKKGHDNLQLDLHQPAQTEESPLKSKVEGESRRKELKDVDSKRSKQHESPEKGQRDTHNEDRDVREWESNDDFGGVQKNKLNKPQEIKQEKKAKAADEPDFEEFEFDA